MYTMLNTILHNAEYNNVHNAVHNTVHNTVHNAVHNHLQNSTSIKVSTVQSTLSLNIIGELVTVFTDSTQEEAGLLCPAADSCHDRKLPYSCHPRHRRKAAVRFLYSRENVFPVA